MRAAHGRHLRARRGMTLVELMVAIMILAVGLLALAGVAGAVGRQISAGGLQTKAALSVQSRFDSLSSLDCTTLAATGTATGLAGLTENWVVTDGNDIKTITNTVTLKGRTNPLVYATVIPCRD